MRTFFSKFSKLLFYSQNTWFSNWLRLLLIFKFTCNNLFRKITTNIIIITICDDIRLTWRNSGEMDWTLHKQILVRELIHFAPISLSCIKNMSKNPHRLSKYELSRVRWVEYKSEKSSHRNMNLEDKNLRFPYIAVKFWILTRWLQAAQKIVQIALARNFH